MTEEIPGAESLKKGDRISMENDQPSEGREVQDGKQSGAKPSPESAENLQEGGKVVPDR